MIRPLVSFIMPVHHPANPGLTTRLADLREPGDAAALRHLLNLYADDPMGRGRPLDPQVLDALPSSLSNHPTARVFLADMNGQPLGLAVCFVNLATFHARPALNIHDFVVHPDHRRRGIGAALLNAIDQHARAIGCCRITLEVRTDNPAAQSLYQSCGFDAGEPPYAFWVKHLSPPDSERPDQPLAD